MMCAVSFCVLLGFIKRVTTIAWKESVSETILGQIKGSEMTLDEFVTLTPMASFKFGTFINGHFVAMSASDVQGKKDLAVQFKTHMPRPFFATLATVFNPPTFFLSRHSYLSNSAGIICIIALFALQGSLYSLHHRLLGDLKVIGTLANETQVVASNTLLLSPEFKQMQDDVSYLVRRVKAVENSSARHSESLSPRNMIEQGSLIAQDS